MTKIDRCEFCGYPNHEEYKDETGTDGWGMGMVLNVSTGLNVSIGVFVEQDTKDHTYPAGHILTLNVITQLLHGTMMKS